MISHEQQQIENGNRWERLEWNDINLKDCDVIDGNDNPFKLESQI